MLRNVAARESEEHPLERLMDIVGEGDLIVATTTGLHLARCFANALERRFHHGVTVQYAQGDSLVRVEWSA